MTKAIDHVKFFFHSPEQPAGKTRKRVDEKGCSQWLWRNLVELKGCSYKLKGRRYKL